MNDEQILLMGHIEVREFPWEETPGVDKTGWKIFSSSDVGEILKWPEDPLLQLAEADARWRMFVTATRVDAPPANSVKMQERSIPPLRFDLDAKPIEPAIETIEGEMVVATMNPQWDSASAEAHFFLDKTTPFRPLYAIAMAPGRFASRFTLNRAEIYVMLGPLTEWP